MKKLAVVLFTGIVLMLLVLVIYQPVMAGQGANTWTVPGDFVTIEFTAPGYTRWNLVMR